MSLHNNKCFVCGNEYAEEELHAVAISSINLTRYKICNSCVGLSNPDNDYEVVRHIVDTYLKFSDSKDNKKVSRIEQLKSSIEVSIIDENNLDIK